MWSRTCGCFSKGRRGLWLGLGGGRGNKSLRGRLVSHLKGKCPPLDSKEHGLWVSQVGAGSNTILLTSRTLKSLACVETFLSLSSSICELWIIVSTLKCGWEDCHQRGASDWSWGSKLRAHWTFCRWWLKADCLLWLQFLKEPSLFPGDQPDHCENYFLLQKWVCFAIYTPHFHLQYN